MNHQSICELCEREEQLRGELESVGFKCFGAIRNTDKFIYIDGIKY